MRVRFSGTAGEWVPLEPLAQDQEEKTADFVIVGFTEPKRSRVGMGALQLADYLNDELVYAGRVGTGIRG